MKLLRTILLLTLILSFESLAQNVVTMPNIITPNNDGVNDVFRIDAEGFDELSCTIVNRYGAVIYRFHGVNGSWDGYTHTGEKVSPGTYFVYLELSSSDGASYTQQGVLQVQYK